MLPFDAKLLLLAIPVVLIFFVVARGRPKGTEAVYPYQARSALFTAHEQHFLTALESAAGPYRVFAKVRLADVISVRKGLPKGEWRRAFNLISQKHLDFVLCRPHDLSIVCALELDDRSHERADRRLRDAFLERALTAAQVPLVRVAGQRHYDLEELRALLGPAKVKADR